VSSLPLEFDDTRRLNHAIAAIYTLQDDIACALQLGSDGEVINHIMSQSGKLGKHLDYLSELEDRMLEVVCK